MFRGKGSIMGINVETESQVEHNRKELLREELLDRLSGRFSAPEFKTSFPTSTWWQPIPPVNRVKVWTPLLLSLVIGTVVLVSGSNLVAAAILFGLGTITSLLVRKMSNQTFYNPTGASGHIEVTPEAISLPVHYFPPHTWQGSRQVLHKSEINNIELIWHWYRRFYDTAKISTRTASISAFNIMLNDGRHITLSNSTVNCAPLMVSLFKQGYQIHLKQVPDPWRHGFQIGALIFLAVLAWIIGSGVYELYQNGQFPFD
ncbi:hypothetical protein L2750_09510 [Shewanella submarina]|uniref:DUF3592 domain-containing protein n=1 Tax=Shewanella submarina TaxID=2016376 RepID=A0ABV7G7C9_9GAMM|nr:hypothetical protein [Shewanella submarina]MCL1037391.1 hypothetical protein [Shewanella submarina]